MWSSKLICLACQLFLGRDENWLVGQQVLAENLHLFVVIFRVFI